MTARRPFRPARSPSTPARSGARLIPIAVAVAVFGAVVLVLGNPFPSWWDFHVAPAVDSSKTWIIDHRDTHWLFSWVMQPITDTLEALYGWTEDLLNFLGWPGVFAATAVIAYRAAGKKVALVSMGCLLAIGLLGVWEEAVQTMALMAVAVGISLLIGVPLGIMAGRHPKVDSALRGFLDAAQTMPAYCYLLFTVLLFDIGAARGGDRHGDLRPGPGGAADRARHPLRPRRTARGRRSPRRHRPAGAEQGAVAPRPADHPPRDQPGDHDGLRRGRHRRAASARPGLGQSVLNGLEKIDVGLALDAGIAIVLIAVILDRISSGRPMAERRAYARRDPAVKRRDLLIGLAVVAVAVLIARLAHADQLPGRLDVLRSASR